MTTFFFTFKETSTFQFIKFRHTGIVLKYLLAVSISVRSVEAKNKRAFEKKNELYVVDLSLVFAAPEMSI